ncbi:MAG TPA: DEAD/DEAH box helicase, partial [Candidatus Xenobia bacterium]
MDAFHPTIRQWFEGHFDGPTPIQEAGWPAVATGGHVLLSAPTGSGKTLAAFLWSIDRLLQADLPSLPRVLYVSPLKALGNDIERNLREPLRAMQTGIRVAVRTGDSLPADRRRLVTRPPHILITTPESLYLLLGARLSRPILQELDTVIVDEIHALAPTKRGAHLLLSLARLDDLCGRPLQRIGLSATQKPLQRVADFLCHDAPCALIETPLERPRQLSIFCPSQTLSAVASSELWAEVCDRLAETVDAHRTTLIFTHTRRLAERLTRQLADRLGETRVAAHHGALARERRLSAEGRLKSGELSALVATASMELGIDVGHIDIVCHVGAPRSIGNLLQRIGRSGRSLGTDSKGLLFPLTRDDLVQCAAAVRAARQGKLDALTVPAGTPDVLAQQVVAMAVAPEGIDIDQILALSRGCQVYRTLTKATLLETLGMLTEGSRPLLYWDRLHNRIHARPAAVSIMQGSAGTIADTGDYDVIEMPGETPVGRLNEDFAIESSVGDVFLLGSTAWRIRRQSQGRVYVEAAPGQNANIPFWLGEAPARTPELSDEVAHLRLDAARGSVEDDVGLDDNGLQQLYRYVREAHDVLGALPAPDKVVIERFFDESGGMQLVLHAPFGSRINRAWGLALRKRFCVTFDFELQAAATDDGILISLSRRHSFELASVFQYVQAPKLKGDLTAAVLQGQIFGRRWREIATRALLLPRARHGRKVPLPLQRMKAEDLLASVFPDQVMCQDNRTGPVVPPSHPLVDETLRECLEEWMDEPGLRALLGDIKAGRVTCHAIDTVTPSPLSHAILNAMPYAFLDDAPLEERRARAVSTFGPSTTPRLDPTVVDQVSAEAWPRIEDANALHHLLTR